MLHVAMTSCPNSLMQHSLQSSLQLETPEGRTPLPSHPSHQLLASCGYSLIFPFENKTLTQCFSWRPCLRTFRGHCVGWGNYHYSSRCLIDWGSLPGLPLTNDTWSPQLLSLHSYPEGNTYTTYIFLFCGIYILCTRTLICKNVHFYIKVQR